MTPEMKSAIETVRRRREALGEIERDADKHMTTFEREEQARELLEEADDKLISLLTRRER